MFFINCEPATPLCQALLSALLAYESTPNSLYTQLHLPESTHLEMKQSLRNPRDLRIYNYCG